MMYDNFYNQSRFFGGQGPEGFFGPGALFGMSLLGGLFLLLVLASLVLKGFALWHSAKRGEKWWFIALLLINTMGLLELAYLIFFAKVWGRGHHGKFCEDCGKKCKNCTCEGGCCGEGKKEGGEVE
jgi:methionyl-tRNA synthetase